MNTETQSPLVPKVGCRYFCRGYTFIVDFIADGWVYVRRFADRPDAPVVCMRVRMKVWRRDMKTAHPTEAT